MSDSMIFRGGMPYGPDVNKLKETFSVQVLTEGRILSHAELESVILYKKGTQRFYSVIKSWISYCENELGIYMRWKPKFGVEVMDPAVHLSERETGFRQSLRRVGRSSRRIGTIPVNRLDATGQARATNLGMVASRIAQAAASARKEIAVELAPVKSLPKPKLVQAS